ncbi:MAG TPA: putative baseplate assembly protein [Candidatus Kapabacteria bacterium]|nr:putative baseplate assembly protein [Candidatus Kapabacteria bacterium]
MSTVNDNLNTCGCCDPGFEPLPVHYNPSGLPALEYRIGTHNDFLRRMLHRISYQTLPDGDNAGARPLSALSTRSTDDASIALIDAWAVALDVLTFYQERIVNEGYLRTATERRSVLELARMIGYELNPGVAATAYLAFKLDGAKTSPKSVLIPVGMKLQDVPVKEALPQKFEVAEQVEARPEWNEMGARMRSVIPVTPDSTSIIVKGTSANGLSQGDIVVVVSQDRFASATSDNWVAATIASVVFDDDNDITVIVLEKSLAALKGGPLTLTNPRVFALRTRARFFGFNAPDWKLLLQATRANYGNGDDWPGMRIPVDGEFDLNAEYARVVPGSWVIVRGPVMHAEGGAVTTATRTKLYRVNDAQLVSRTDFTLSDMVTRVVPDSTAPAHAPFPAVPPPPPPPDVFMVRGAEVYAQSEELELAEQPEVAPIFGGEIVLDGIVFGLVPGRKAIVTGKRPRMHVLSYDLTLGSLALRRGDSLQVTAPPQMPPTSAAVAVLAALSPALGFQGPAALRMGPGAAAGGLPPTGARSPAGSRGLILGLPDFIIPDADTGADTSAGGGASTGGTSGTSVTCSTCYIWSVLARGGTAGTIQPPVSAYEWQNAEADDDVWSELVEIKSVRNDNVNTFVTLKKNLDGIYDRASFALLGNVVRATHGETIVEELGDGNGSQTNQRFVLKKPPLTYVAAASATGNQDTLEVRVNGVLWKEAPYLYGAGSRSEVYMVRNSNEGKTSVIFGDGRNGARIPSGDGNVTAVYRSGIGLDGNVAADSLTVMQTKPLGVSEVNNPLAAEGGADPENLFEARLNAPVTVLTFDRIVSLRDFEDFTRAFAGVAKAQAVILWNGSTQIVHVTVAGAGEKPAGTELQTNLRNAIDSLRDPTIEYSIGGYRECRFNIAARITVDSRYLPEVVKASVKQALNSRFSFDAREFGQSVSSSEVISVIQKTEGVVWVDLDALYFAAQPGATVAPSLSSVLAGRKARWTYGSDGCGSQTSALATPALPRTGIETLVRVTPATTPRSLATIKDAQLLLINPDGIDINLNSPQQ